MGRNMLAPLCTRGKRNQSPGTPSPYERITMSRRLPGERLSQESGNVCICPRKVLTRSGRFICILPLTKHASSVMGVSISALYQQRQEPAPCWLGCLKIQPLVLLFLPSWSDGELLDGLLRLTLLLV